jgi:single-strand DNA-binding protein
MTEAAVSFAGNLTDDPELRYTEAGIARAMLRVAVSGRRDQEPSFFTVIVWRDQAEHAAQSLAKGSRVVVVGRLQQRSWTAEDGSARSTPKGIGRSPMGEVVLLSAIAAFAVPAALGIAHALPPVESESAAPGHGHRRLLGP